MVGSQTVLLDIIRWSWLGILKAIYLHGIKMSLRALFHGALFPCSFPLLFFLSSLDKLIKSYIFMLFILYLLS